MANGQVINERTIRYTFTDYINNKKDLTAELNLNLFMTNNSDKARKMKKLK